MNKKTNGTQTNRGPMDFADVNKEFAINNPDSEPSAECDDVEVPAAPSPDPDWHSALDQSNPRYIFKVEKPWHETNRAAPSEFLRSALFSPNRRENRLMVGERLATNQPIDLIVRGDTRTQFDLDLWMACVHLARFGEPVRTKIPELLKVAGRSPGGSTELRVRESLELLGCFTVSLNVNAKVRKSGLSVPGATYRFDGPLIEHLSWERGAGRWDYANIVLHPDLAELFRPQRRTHIPARVRSQLGDRPLAQWMYAFFRTHRNVLPLPLEYYQRISGAGSSDSDFHSRAKKAMTLLAEKSFIYSASLREGRLYVQRNKPAVETTYPDAEWTVQSPAAITSKKTIGENK